MRRWFRVFMWVAALAGPATTQAATIDFESPLVDLNANPTVATSLGAVNFTNATVLSAFSTTLGSLDDSQFPPHSYDNVVGVGRYLAQNDPFDPLVIDPSSGGVMRIDFAQAMSAVSGYFTFFGGQLQLRAFDAADQLLGQTVSPGTDNLGANELFSLLFNGITYVEIEGAGGPFSFTLDDLELTPLDTATAVPEPATLTLMLAGVATLAARRQGAP